MGVGEVEIEAVLRDATINRFRIVDFGLRIKNAFRNPESGLYALRIGFTTVEQRTAVQRTLWMADVNLQSEIRNPQFYEPTPGT